MSDYDMMQNSPNSTAINQRTSLLNDVAASVPAPPAYPGQTQPSLNVGPGLLRTKISLGGRKPAVVMPFLLMKPELPAPSPITGGMNLLTYYGLDHAWNKFCVPNKKLKEELSAFLPHLPGNIDKPGHLDNSSLRSLIDKPPITGKEILPLSTSALAGFKLQSGSIPEQYRVFAGGYPPASGTSVGESVSDTKSGHHSRKKHKRKHERSSRGSEDRGREGGPHEERSQIHGASTSSSITPGSGLAFDGGASISGAMSLATDETRKPKTEEGVVSEKKKKKKKEKKRKRSRSPERSSDLAHGNSGFQSSNPPSASGYNVPDFTF